MNERRLEQEFVLAVGRYGWLPDANNMKLGEELLSRCRELDWAFLTTQLYRHRLMGLGWQMLAGPWTAAGGSLPRGYALHETWYRATAYRNELMRSEIQRFTSALADVGVKTVLRRGPALIDHAYQDLGARPMSDIDVLVLPGQEELFTSTLIRLGYRIGNISADKTRVLPRKHADRALQRLLLQTGDTVLPVLVVDPGNSLSEQPLLSKLSAEKIFASALQDDRFGIQPVTVMAPHHLLLDLCTHLYEESTTASFVKRGRHQRILQYVDILALLSRTAADWEAVETSALSYGLAAPAYFALENARRLYPEAPVPHGVTARLASAACLGSDFPDRYGHGSSARHWSLGIRERMFDETVPVGL